MKSDIIPVRFSNKDGLKLFGILHKPKKILSGHIAIIILSPGIKSRVAPHRLYVKMARRFAEMGFPVLRFDFYGLGDSEGEVNEQYVADFYGSVQVGRYNDDTISAMDWMEEECGTRKFILSGLCGGAITGLLAGAKDERVDSLIGLGIPVILDSSNIDHNKYITEGQLKGLRHRYIKKIFSPKAWLSFLSLQSDYRILFKSLTQPLRKKPKLVDNGSTNMEQPLNKQHIENSDNLNPHFPVAFRRFASSKKLLLVFSEADRLYWEFEEKFVSRYKQDFERLEKNLEIHITKDANHIFSFSEWQEDMLAISSSWLKMHYNLIHSGD